MGISKHLRRLHRKIQAHTQGFYGASTSVAPVKEEDFQKICYGQEGEDMILNSLFGFKQPSFYVDVGVHHPFRFSNTFFFYQLGWRGINIDAAPGSMSLFHQFRDRDTNIEIATGNEIGIQTVFAFAEPALNTMDPVRAKQLVASAIQ